MSRMVSKREFATRLGVSERHLDNMRTTGRVPKAVKLGTRVGWPEPLLERWFAAGCPQTDSVQETQEVDERV